MKWKEKLFEILPAYGWLPLIITFVWNSLVYGGAKMIAGNWHHYNIETKLDTAIPFVPWTIIIYFGCYLFWAVNYILVVRQSKERAYRFLSADVLAKCVCLVFFLILPTTNTRPQVGNGSIWELLMRFLYRVDSAENLFPSIHCLVSWMCFIGIRDRKNISVPYRTFSCLMAVAVFISTLTTKQHVLADVVGGVVLAEAAYWITGHTKLAEMYQRLFERIGSKCCSSLRGEVAGEK